MRNLVLGMAALGAFASAAWADAPKNILFYGNSFTLMGANATYGVTGVPTLVQKVAAAAGQTAPNVENAAASGMTLSWHISNNVAKISNPTDFNEAAGFKWDYVVLQEYSTKPTNIAGVGDPTGFKNDAQTLYNTVKAHSANVTPVMFETWARSPNNTSELSSFYPAPPTYLAKATQMQSELRQYYGEARTQIGASITQVAPVGDAIEKSGFDSSLYNGDYYHESAKGSVLASLVLYETMYKDNVSDISYTTMNSQLPLSSWGIYSASEWNSLTALADSVPEPTSLGIVGVSALAMLRRPRRARRGAVRVGA